MDGMEADVDAWRTYLADRETIDDRALDELEDHLRSQIGDLSSTGLADDEAFLIAVKRMGALDALSGEFAREYSGRLWSQLVTPVDVDREADRGWIAAIALAVASAISLCVALWLDGYPDEEPSWVLRNASLLVLPYLAAFFVLRRRLGARKVAVTFAPFAAAALLVNLYPFAELGSTELLVALHLPVLLWIVCAYPYTGGDVISHERRMDFVRFTGEWFVYFVLFALGGGVLVGLTAAILEPVGVDAERVVSWVVPAGAAGAVLVAASLVESKQNVVENIAPVLTMVFTPLFAAMLTIAALIYLATGVGGEFDRELIFVFDALLIVVVGLILYGVSAREPFAPPGWLDRTQLVAIVAALVLNGLVLASMLARVGDLGFTPNRAVALGLNLVLLANLAMSAWILIRFVAGRDRFHRLERWQTSYLPVFAAWAAIVVIAIPPLFGFE